MNKSCEDNFVSIVSLYCLRGMWLSATYAITLNREGGRGSRS